eukprot:GHVL01006466.1.p1 GENE.GHVL01006466.1~~GHVL01006466.1.p1  ORF type:complete len:450 (+),score=77.65 GHVL01006466.1:280-1629(+)
MFHAVVRLSEGKDFPTPGDIVFERCYFADGMQVIGHSLWGTRHDEDVVDGELQLFREKTTGEAPGGGCGFNVLPLERSHVILILAIPSNVTADMSFIGSNHWSNISHKKIFTHSNADYDNISKKNIFKKNQLNVDSKKDQLNADSRKRKTGSKKEQLNSEFNINIVSNADSKTNKSNADLGNDQLNADLDCASFYSLLLIMKSQGAADNFYREFHGRAVTCSNGNSDSRIAYCYIVFLSSVSYIQNTKDKPFLPLTSVSVVQIPSCPSCLERFDVSSSGIVTQPSGWLSSMKLPSLACRVCRTIDTKSSLINNSFPRKGQFLKKLGPLKNKIKNDLSCQSCDHFEDMWICMVCAHCGCGRYSSGHARQHAMDLCHLFALDIQTGRVWDYGRDVFVHRRLVQSAAAAHGDVRFGAEMPESCIADSGEKKGFSQSVSLILFSTPLGSFKIS